MNFFAAMAIGAVVAFTFIGIAHTGLMVFDHGYAKVVRAHFTSRP